MTPDELKDWLNARPEETRQQEGVWIAHRCAMRVLPVWWGATYEHGLSPVPVLRSCLISGVAALKPDSSVALAAGAAARANTAANANASGTLSALGAALGASNSANAASTRQSIGSTTEYAVSVALNVIGTISRFGYVSNGNSALARDVDWLKDGNAPGNLALWAGETPDLGWLDWQSNSASRDGGPWTFWIDWYQRALDGTPQPMDLLEKIALRSLEEGHEDFWDGTDGEVNTRIAEIVAEWEAGQETQLSKAAIVDFRFDEALRQMEMIGFDEDVAHLKDPKMVQRFLDDAEELRDGLQDFEDYSEAARHGNNALAMLGLSSEKVLAELTRTEDRGHIRARRLITLGHHLTGFALEEDKRTALGPTLSEMLDANVSLLRELCREHLSPAIRRIDALDDLALEDRDPHAMLADLRGAVAKLRELEGAQTVALTPEARAVLGDMINELEEIAVASEESKSEIRRETLKTRFARTYGATSATVGRYLEKSRPHAQKANSWLDGLIKNYKKWNSLSDIISWLGDLFGGGPPPAP